MTAPTITIEIPVDLTSLQLLDLIKQWANDGTLNELLNKYVDDLTTELLASVDRAGTYVYMRERGNNHNFAEMVACQQGPGSLTDRELFRGQGTLLDQLDGDERRLKSLLRSAKKYWNFVPGPNDVYNPSCAPGDAKGKKGHPDCFVSPTGGLSHLRAIARKKGMEVLPGLSSEGQLRINPGEAREPPKRKVGLGENIIRYRTRDALKKNPELARLPAKELRERIIDKHALKT